MSVDSLPVDPETTTLYRGLDRLPPALWDDLTGLAPMDAAYRAGVRYDPALGYIVPFLGVDHRVDPVRRTIEVPEGTRPPGFQTGLILLSYLAHAAEEGLSGRMVTERELDGGELFFKGPHALSKEPVLRRFGRDGQGLMAKARVMGARPAAEGDVSFRLLALPKILVGFTLYEGDDEFEAGLTITFDSFTHRHLALDGIWALINVLSHRLAGE
jgi:hypothetical protein